MTLFRRCSREETITISFQIYLVFEGKAQKDLRDGYFNQLLVNVDELRFLLGHPVRIY